ncbi:hypothetical protein K4M64_004540 [Salmonella enterica]|nr:hypothetical protein [Salmonella enterica]
MAYVDELSPKINNIGGSLVGGLLKHKSSKSTEKTDSSSKNLLAQNQTFMNLFNQGITEGNNMNIPAYEMAQYGPGFDQALANLEKGVSPDEYKTAQSYLTNLGQGQLTSGLALQSQSQGLLSRLANMTPEQYRAGYASEYNNDLVNSQINEATQNINQERDQAIYSLNQNATATGNMGSSRSGIAQGVIVGKAAQAIGSATVQYQTAEEQLAEQRFMNMLGVQQSSASSLANLANQQTQFGYGAYNQGMQYKGMYDQTYLQNQQNAVNAGLMSQQIRQQQLDYQRQNYLMASSPALARLSYMSPILSPLASSGMVGTSTKVTTTPGSNLLSGIAGAAGAAIGGFYGGPEGAKIGAGIGGGLGNSFGS